MLKEGCYRLKLRTPQGHKAACLYLLRVQCKGSIGLASAHHDAASAWLHVSISWSEESQT